MPQTIELVRVKTTLGDRVYPLDTRVYSNVGGKNLYFRESVSDLNGNEMILWHNESIEKTLEEVEPYLQRSPRYQRAEQTVYATNSQGQKMPQFRIQLIRALAAKGVVTAESQEDLEQRIMREGGRDFTQQQYGAMTEFLYQKLQRIGKEDDAPTRSEAQIREWLHGKTLAPQNSNIFYSLALATGSPVFEEWFMGAKDTATSSSGFWGAYKFYTTLRQTIMRYLARSKGELKGKTSDNSSTGTEAQNGHRRENLDMTPEIQIVLHQFMEEINEEFSLARIVGVEKVTIGVKDWHEQKAKLAPSLHKGAYTGQPIDGTATLSLKRLLSEQNFFGGFAAYIFEDYFDGCMAGKYTAPKGLVECLGEVKRILPQLENPFVYGYFSEHLWVAIADKLGLTKSLGELEGINVASGFTLAYVDQKTGENVTKGCMRTISDLMADYMLSGEMDTALGLRGFSVYGVIENWARSYNSLPAVFNDFSQNFAKLRNPVLGRKERRDLQLQRGKLEDKLKRRYGYELGQQEMFLIEYLSQVAWEGAMASIRRTMPRDLAVVTDAMEGTKEKMQSLRNPDYLRSNVSFKLKDGKVLRIGETLFSAESGFFTKAESAEILESHGLPEQLMRFIPEANFVLDEQPKSGQQQQQENTQLKAGRGGA